jgi:hypothetical protein
MPTTEAVKLAALARNLLQPACSEEEISPEVIATEDMHRDTLLLSHIMQIPDRKLQTCLADCDNLTIWVIDHMLRRVSPQSETRSLASIFWELQQFKEDMTELDIEKLQGIYADSNELATLMVQVADPPVLLRIYNEGGGQGAHEGTPPERLRAKINSFLERSS